MAGISTDIWEFRATAGNANAGGGFDTASGGTDYSNQDSAQLQLTDLATSGIGVTTLTSVTGGFTAAMIGNYIQIRSGTNVTAGFYRVTAHTDTNTVTLDRAPDDGVGGISGGSGDLGGALDILTDAFLDDANVVVAGNTIHVKNDGVMTLSGAISLAKDGTPLAYITIEGYNTSRGDSPVGSNRPVIAAGANAFNLDNFWRVKNIIGTTTHVSGFELGIAGQFINCKVTNSSGTNNREAMDGFTGSAYIRCEGVSTNGVAFGPIASGRLISCYAHDSVVGFNFSVFDANVIFNCVFDTCTTGIASSTNATFITLINNTFFNCTTAVAPGATNDGWVIINNIFDANVDGVKWGDADKSLYMDYNCWDNTTDVTNVSKGPNAVNGDPGLTDPANGDFTLGSGSNCLDAGLGVSADVGVVGEYKWNIGADQDDVSAGGAASILGGGNLEGGFA